MALLPCYFESVPLTVDMKTVSMHGKRVAYLDLLISGSDEPFSFPKENCDLKRLLVVVNVVNVVTVVNAGFGETTAC